MISNVDADKKAGSIICGLERSEHFKEIIERISLARHNAPRAFSASEFREDFGDVIRYCAVLNVRAPKNMANQNVEIETRRNTQTRSEERRVGKECRSRWSPYP